MSIGRSARNERSIIGRGATSGGGGGTGEANTGLNIGTAPAVAIYDSKSGVILRFNGVAGEIDGNNVLPWGVFKIKNETGAQLNAGYAVTAVDVDTSDVYKAKHLDPSVEAERENYLGVVFQNVADTATGYAIRFGEISGYDTSGFSVLDSLYVSAVTDGLLTNIDPGGDASFPVGLVKKVDLTTGIINAIPKAGTGAGGITDHALLSNLNSVDYSHLTAAQLTDLTDAGDSALHYHASDRNRANHTGTQPAATISDFDTEVSNNTDVAANTAHRSSDGKDHSDVVLNNTHRTSDGTDHGNVVLNDSHRTGDGSDHADVALNTTHRGSDGKDHSDVVANTALAHARAHSITATADHSDVEAGPPSKNDVLKFNGAQWKHVPEGTSFTFSIATFLDTGGASPVEIGVGTWKAIGAISFSASYNNGPAIATPTVQLSGRFAAWASPLSMTTAPDYEGPTVSVEAIAYPSAPSSNAAIITLSATDGVDPDTDTNVYYFYNNRHWGVDSSTSLDEAGIEGLANKELSNSRAKTFTVTAAAGEYIWYCYPTRLGTATFTVGGFEGGFESPLTVSVTNPSGYTENYYAYRSTNAGLGSTTVVVS
jgi:hypothetical protein